MSGRYTRCDGIHASAESESRSDAIRYINERHIWVDGRNVVHPFERIRAGSVIAFDGWRPLLPVPVRLFIVSYTMEHAWHTQRLTCVRVRGSTTSGMASSSIQTFLNARRSEDCEASGPCSNLSRSRMTIGGSSFPGLWLQGGSTFARRGFLS